MFTLTFFAILLPTAAQSIMTGLLLIWFIATKAWRHLPILIVPFKKFDGRELWQRHPVFVLLVSGVLLSSIIHLLLLILHWTQGQSSEHEGKLLEEHLRLMGKQGIYGIFLSLVFLVGRYRQWNARLSLNILSVLVSLLFLYVLVQRYTGINWVHGFSSFLPPNRFSYGVYRASGFMGHPLTFAYNCMIFTLITFGFAIFERRASQRHWQWLYCSFLGFLCLFLSGSRWPLIVTIALLLLGSLKSLARSKFMVGGLILTAMWFLFFDQGTLKRFYEVMGSDKRIEEREPRLIFWKVHWSMFRDHPMIGVGYTQRERERLDYYEKAGYTNLERKYSAHNIYLQTLADSGLIGFLALLSLLAGTTAAGVIAWRRDRYVGLVLICGATLLAGLMQNNLRDSEYLFALWMCFAWFSANQKDSTLEFGSEIKDYQH